MNETQWQETFLKYQQTPEYKQVNRGMSLAAFLDGLPDYLAARDFRAVVDAIVRARGRGAPVLLGIGAHFIKVGLSPLLLRALRDGGASHQARPVVVAGVGGIAVLDRDGQVLTGLDPAYEGQRRP